MKKIAILKILLYTLVLVIIFLLFWKVFYPNWSYITEWLYPSETDKNAKSLQLIFSVIGGLVIIAGLYISYKRVYSIEKSVRIQQKTLKGQNKIIENQTIEIELSRKSQINEQFKIAVEHIGNSNQAVVNGGFIELVFIAEEDPKKYAEIVHKLFCSYLRSESSMKKEDIQIDYYLAENILKFLFNSTILKSKKSDLSNLNFKKCSFEKIQFENVDFSECYMPLKLKDSSFINCIFNNTKFVNTNIKLNFFKAFEKEVNEVKKIGTLSNVKFENCEGNHIYFHYYDLTNIKFIGCDNLSMIKFSHCFLHNITGNIIYSGSQHFFSEFVNINFPNKANHIEFYGCDFQSIDLSDSEISNCEIAYCKFTNIITESRSNSLKFSDNRILEPRFNPKTYYRISFVPIIEFLKISTKFEIENHPFFKYIIGKIYVGNTSDVFISQVIEKYKTNLKEMDIVPDL